LRVFGHTESLGLASNSQSFWPALRVEGAHPAVALRVDHLHHAAELGDRDASPLAVQDLVARRGVLPDHLARLLVDRDQRGRARRGDVDVALVLTVAGADVDQVAPRDRRGVREVVGHHAELFHHVELPHDVAVVLARELLVLVRAVVLAVLEALGVDREQLAAVRHVVEPVALDERRAGDALVGPVVRAARGQLLVRDLPEERAVLLAEGDQHAAVARLLGSRSPSLFVPRNTLPPETTGLP
jgi:hypothetical protein